MGFGWYCIKFKSNGKYKEDGGHSYWVHRTYGKWTLKGDTIVCRPKLYRSIRPYSIIYKSAERSPTYFILTKDSIYTLNFNTDTRKMEKGVALRTWE